MAENEPSTEATGAKPREANQTGVRDPLVERWMRRITREEKAHKGWRKEAEEAENDYFDEAEGKAKQLFPLFWANVQTLHAALLSNTPKPDVRRRFQRGDAIGQAGKIGAQVIERAIAYELDVEDFDGPMARVIDDFLIAGAGVPWVAYDAETEDGEDGEPAQIGLQRVYVEHVPWRRLHWEPVQSWKDVDWVARDHYLSAGEIKRRFKIIAPEHGGKREDGDKSNNGQPFTYRVIEIWHKPTRSVMVIGEDFDEPLEVRKDALGLSGFFPCPEPLFANIRSRRLLPKPDYTWYRESAEQVNRLTARIKAISRQLKVAGFYDADLSELSSLSSQPDGTYLPIRKLSERLASAGSADFNKVIATLPIEDKARVLVILTDMRDREKQIVFEITGIADIVRGVSSATETLGAQRIKAQFANLRLARRQRQVARLIRDVFRIMAEIIAEHFTPEQMFLASGVQVDAQTMQIIRSDIGRQLAIDVESDSTIAEDDEVDKTAKLEMLNTVSGFVNSLVPALQNNALPADLVKEMLRVAVGSFKHGRNLEDAIEALPDTQQQLQQLGQQLQQAQQQLQQQAQQAQQQIQQMQTQLGQVNERKEAREDAKTRAEIEGKQARAEVDALRAVV